MVKTLKDYFKTQSSMKPEHSLEVYKVSSGQVNITVEDSQFLFFKVKLSYGLGRAEIKKLIKVLENSLER